MECVLLTRLCSSSPPLWVYVVRYFVVLFPAADVLSAIPLGCLSADAPRGDVGVGQAMPSGDATELVRVR